MYLYIYIDQLPYTCRSVDLKGSKAVQAFFFDIYIINHEVNNTFSKKKVQMDEGLRVVKRKLINYNYF